MARKLHLKATTADVEEEADQLARARRKMEEKARLYAAMKRGDYVPKENEPESLIDFDRKWAEGADGDPGDYSSSDTDSEDAGREEMIEYEDEFGRLRRGTKSDKERMERRLRRGVLGSEHFENMSARPAAPSNVIYGDTIQTMAFMPEDGEKMEELARKRDRSATPPELKHYDADREIRTKGVGFYKFSKDEAARVEAMKSLEEERLRTEKGRQEREDKKAVRKREIEERRKEIEARRAQKLANSFLDGLASELENGQGT